MTARIFGLRTELSFTGHSTPGMLVQEGGAGLVPVRLDGTGSPWRHYPGSVRVPSTPTCSRP